MRRLVLPTLGRFSDRVLRFSPPAIVDRLDQELVYAGSPAGLGRSALMAAKWLTAVGLAVAAVVAAAARSSASLAPSSAVLAGASSATTCPSGSSDRVLESARRRSSSPCRTPRPDVDHRRSGLSFDAALDRVSREMGGPLGEELHRVVQEMRLGRAAAKRCAISRRTTVDELKAFVMAMVQAEIFGISIAKVLHVQAGELRIKRRQRAEEKAQKLPVKIVFPLVLCIFPAIFVVLLGPAAISIYENIIVGL
jgi:tight adherence protein C